MDTLSEMMVLWWYGWTVSGSYRTDEAGVVPGVAQSLDELIASFNREVTAMTLRAEECDVIWQRGRRREELSLKPDLWPRSSVKTRTASSYLSRSTALRPPCGRGCFRTLCRRPRTRSRWCATSAAERASLPATRKHDTDSGACVFTTNHTVFPLLITRVAFWSGATSVICDLNQSGWCPNYQSKACQ